MVKMRLIDKEGKEYDLPNKNEIKVGRTVGENSVNDVKIISSDLTRHVSRNHCKIYRRGDELRVVDGESMNGVYVNGIRIPKNKKAILNDGDKLGLGHHYKLEVRIEGGSTEFEFEKD